jgi:hypothetical protein
VVGARASGGGGGGGKGGGVSKPVSMPTCANAPTP